MAQLEARNQVRHFTVGAGFEFGPGLAAFGILDNQRRAIAGFIAAKLKVKRLKVAHLIIGRLFFAHQSRKVLADFRLTPGDFN